MNRITRDEAINEAGIESVQVAENGGFDFTNRVLGNGFVEFCSTEAKVFADEDGLSCHVNVYVYFDQDLVDSVETLDCLDWEKALEEAEYEIFG